MFIKTKRGIFFNLWYQYNSFCLKDFTVSVWSQWSPSHKSRYGHSADNVRENVSGYGLGLRVFVLSQNYNVCFYSSSRKFCHSTTTVCIGVPNTSSKTPVSPPLPKSRIFQWPLKYWSFPCLIPSYPLKVTTFLGKISQFEFLVMTEKYFCL